MSEMMLNVQSESKLKINYKQNFMVTFNTQGLILRFSILTLSIITEKMQERLRHFSGVP